MPVKFLIALIVIATLSALVWRYGDSAIVRNWAFGELAAHANPTTGSRTAPANTPSSYAGLNRVNPALGVRKCQVDGKLTYTNGACPSGSREQALGGSLTVMSLRAATTPLASPGAASHATVRDLVGHPGEATLSEKRIDESIAR
jgi:hypothetical protein